MDPIAPPRAHAQLLVEGVIRQSDDDFLVDELAAVEPTGEGEHLLLRIEKRGLNSADVAQDLVRAFGVEPVDVSFAGMKDRHAVTRQWFSVRGPRDGTGLDAQPFPWRVLETARHARKLRRGDLAGNRFRVRVRNLRGDVVAIRERLELLRERGAPNYFAEQRFGRDGANVERARSWVCHRPRANVSAFQRGLHLSTARALLFNAVLGHRVVAGSWDRLIDGDVACDGSPTGPLWGRGRPPASGAALATETHALAALNQWLDPLEHLGLSQQRRILVLRPIDLGWEFDTADLELNFVLAPGQYATALLREIGEFSNAAGAPQ